MTTTTDTIASEIKNYINSNGGPYSAWYVGIASNPTERLFTDHNANKDYGQWIYRDAGSSSEARKIEDYFINTIGTDGGTGGGDYSTRYVYAYKKTTITNP